MFSFANLYNSACSNAVNPIRIHPGSGSHPEIFPRLFCKFATKSDKGMGLGLYISKNIIDAHGGRIWAQNNRSGIGATFFFSLPLDKKK